MTLQANLLAALILAGTAPAFGRPPMAAETTATHASAPKSPVDRTTPSPAATAHALLVAGRIDEATTAYRELQRSAPNHIDTLLGLAVLAVRDTRPSEAAHWYQAALAVEPDNPAAAAGLIGLNPGLPATSALRQLHRLLDRHPASAAIRFALGNAHARNADWPEAARAFRLAHQADRTNADALFNLAVSLDHLGDATHAATYYRAAAEAARVQPVGFDTGAAITRLRELSESPEKP